MPAAAAPEAAAPAEKVQAAGYPPLQSVPPRPQLSYTIQQQRQIVDALVADRENARYTSEVIRYRSGLSSLPPPPAPPAPTAAAPVEPAHVAPEPSLTQEKTLAEFLRALRGQIWPDEPEPTPAAPPSAAPPAPPASAADAPSAENTGEAPVPPPRGAVAARLAERPDPVGQLLDDGVAQAPLPPDQSAVVARLAATDRIRANAPLPAPRPAPPGGDPASLPAPPPTKPFMPVSAPSGPRPVDGGSASDARVTAKAMS